MQFTLKNTLIKEESFNSKKMAYSLTHFMKYISKSTQMYYNTRQNNTYKSFLKITKHFHYMNIKKLWQHIIT